jgi:hypothetical protein
VWDFLHGDNLKHCRTGYSSLVARDIDSPQIRLFYGSSVNPNDVARVIKAQAVQGFLGDGINICRSLPNNEFCSAEHSDNVARKVDKPELRISKARKVQTMSRCVAFSRRYRMYLGACRIQPAW